MPESGGIGALREKLHARMAALRRGGGPRYDSRSVNGSPSEDKDALLNERRLQRAAMRERRRKETKEKIRREEEMKGRARSDLGLKASHLGKETKEKPVEVKRSNLLPCIYLHNYQFLESSVFYGSE